MVLIPVDIHILIRPPVTLLKKKKKMKESHSLLVTSAWFQLTHGGLLNLLLITPSTLSVHLPLNGSNFLLLSFSGYLIFPCFHLFSVSSYLY